MQLACARIGVAVGVIAGMLGLVPAASSDERLTLDDCIALGLERNAAAVNAQRDREIGRTLIKQARSEAWPQLSASASYTRLDEVQAVGFGDQSFAFGVRDNYSVVGKVEQLLYSGGRVSAARRAAGLAQDFFNRGAKHTEQQVIRDVRRGFYRIMLARETVAVRREALVQLESHAREADRQARAGTVAEYDRLSAEVRVANERPSLIAAKKAHQQAALNLRRLLGIEARSLAVDGALVWRPVATSLADLLHAALESRADIDQMELQVRLDEQQVEVARSGNRPRLRAFFNYDGANTDGFAEYEDEWEWHWKAGITADWPFGDGGLTAAQVRERELELAQTRTRLDELQRRVRMEVEMAYLEMKRAREAIDAGRGTVALAQKALSIAAQRFEAGIASSLEYSDSQLALRTARLTELQALHDHMRAVAELEYACGLDRGVLGSAPENGEDRDHE